MNPQQPGGPWPPTNPQNGAQQPYQNAPAPQPNMSPQQHYGMPVQNSSQQQYEFIMNGANRPKRSLLAGSSKTMQIALLVTLIAVVLVLVISFVSFLNKPKISSVALISAAQQQTELIRIATLATSNGTSQVTLNSAYSIKLGLSSDQQQLLGYMSTNNIKITNTQLAIKKSTQTTQQLQSSLSSSTFDSTYKDIVQAELTAYQKTLQTAYKASSGSKGKELLNRQYNAAGLLLQQTKQQ